MDKELETRFDELALRREMTKINKQIKKQQAKYDAVYKEFMDTCPHTDLKLMKECTPGGYLDTGYEDRWMQCTVCGAKGPVDRQSDGSYG